MRKLNAHGELQTFPSNAVIFKFRRLNGNTLFTAEKRDGYTNMETQKYFASAMVWVVYSEPHHSWDADEAGLQGLQFFHIHIIFSNVINSFAAKATENRILKLVIKGPQYDLCLGPCVGLVRYCCKEHNTGIAVPSTKHRYCVKQLTWSSSNTQCGSLRTSFDSEVLDEIPTRSPQMRTPNTGGIGKISDFQLTSR